MGAWDRLRTQWGLMPGDLTRVAPIALAYSLTLTTLYILKPARNALFLDRLGFAQLPYVMLLVAGVGGLFALTYARYAAWMRTDQLVRRTLIAMIGFLVLFRGLLEVDTAWVYFAFYVWVQLFGLLATSLVWLWANAAFDSRAARRVFGFIGTGGIAGAILGGLFTGQVAPAVGTKNLLWVAILVLGGVLLCLRFAPRTRIGAASPVSNQRGSGRQEAGSLGRLLALKAGLIALVAVFVDLQFNLLVDQNFPDSEAKAAFFGRFFAGISGFSLLFQLLVTPWLLARFGVGVALSVLPVALGLGASLGLSSSGFGISLLPKAADGSFRHSVHKAAQEVLFIPMPSASKKRIKLFIDTTVDTAFTGIGALLVLLLTGPLGMGYDGLSLWVVTMVAGVMAVVVSLRTAYVNAFRRAIEGRRIDPEELTTQLNEAVVVDALTQALASDNPRQVLYGLELLSSAPGVRSNEAILKLVRHDVAEVRLQALQVLAQQQAGALPPEVLEPLLDDETDDIRIMAWALRSRSDLQDTLDRVKAHLTPDDPDLPIYLAVVGHLPQEELRMVLEDRVQALVDAAERRPEVRPALAGTLGASGVPAHRPHLQGLLLNSSHAVTTAAMEGMARGGDVSFIPWLVDRLSDRRMMGAARQALVRFGDAAVSALQERLTHEATPLRARRAAVRALADIGTYAAVDAMLDGLDRADPLICRDLLGALLRVRRRMGVEAPRAIVHRELRRRLELLEAIDGTEVAFSKELEAPTHRSVELFARVLTEKRGEILEELMQVLALKHPVDEMDDAARNLRSADPVQRANALEFLENVLTRTERRWLMPVLESTSPRERLARQGRPVPTREAVLRGWREAREPWLRACAVFASRDLTGEAVDAEWNSDGHPLVRETLDHVSREDLSPS